MAKSKAKLDWKGEWEPTGKMRSLLRAWKEEVGAPITKLLESCGLNSSWYYDVFQNDPRAQQWFEEEREKFFNGPRLREVHDQLYTQAVAESSTQHHFMKMYLQRFDPAFVERKESKHTIDVRLQHAIPVEDRLALLREALARARGLPEAPAEDVIEGELVEKP